MAIATSASNSSESGERSFGAAQATVDRSRGTGRKYHRWMPTWLQPQSWQGQITMFRRACLVFFLLAGALTVSAKPRARDIGISFEGTPGPFNAITDVAGVEIGHITLISGEGKLEVGRG